MTWLDEAIDGYIHFLREHTVHSAVDNGWFSITTPFLNIYNDCIEIYCKKEAGKIILSDGGETLNNLKLSGVTISRSPKRRMILDQILLNYGVSVDDHRSLVVMTDMNGFAQAKHDLLSAIMEISDMYMVSKPNVFTVFRDDVNDYLDEQEIIYTPGFISKGASGVEFNFDFQIAHRKTEILLNTFNTINKSNLAIFLFNWGDIKEAREIIAKKSVRGLAIINDDAKEPNLQLLNALESKGAEYIIWSKRHEPRNVAKLKDAA